MNEKYPIMNEKFGAANTLIFGILLYLFAGLSLLTGLVLLIGLASCSSGVNLKVDSMEGLYPEVSVSAIPSLQVSRGLMALDYKPSVRVESVEDQRPDTLAYVQKDVEVRLRSDFSRSLQYLMRKAFKQKGFASNKDAAVTLNTGVGTWKARLDGAALKAEVVINVNVEAPGGEKVYTALHEGYASIPAETVYQSSLQKALGQAMSQALSAVVNDEALLKVLSAY